MLRARSPCAVPAPGRWYGGRRQPSVRPPSSRTDRCRGHEPTPQADSRAHRGSTDPRLGGSHVADPPRCGVAGRHPREPVVTGPTGGPAAVHALLLGRGETVAVAESLTGGLLAAALT